MAAYPIEAPCSSVSARRSSRRITAGFLQLFGKSLIWRRRRKGSDTPSISDTQLRLLYVLSGSELEQCIH